MPLRARLPFLLSLVGDGTDCNISIVVASSPLALIPIAGQLSPAFGIASAAPSAITNLDASPKTITGSTYLLGVLAVTFAAAPAANAPFTLSGDLEFQMYSGNITFDNSGSPDAYTVQSVCRRITIQEHDRTVGTLAKFNVYGARQDGTALSQYLAKLGGEQFVHTPLKFLQPGDKPFYVETVNVASAIFDYVEE